ncbi:hypothetical protein J4E93_009002 [Alternaria ventricosa]|uniref:uncharacterized protein n=1 Tax=Alternaria ventricosa TaxID=1187951 RepID=UPI0020C4E961|nr:uncharacterized protein J4E93_009002 [Alternaria ventricosa]KAI4639648.1 hypothetical protein J4E93_009002 [Alternaria ventricosa]
MPVNNSSTQTGDVTTHADATGEHDLTIDRSSRINELKATQTSLVELMFDLVKDKAESVGKDAYLTQMEKRLEELEETLRQQRECLDESERECQSLTLAAKMYKMKSELYDRSVTQETAMSKQDGYVPDLPEAPKRSLGEMQSESESQPAPAAKRVKVAKERIVVCIFCFRNGMRCDSEEPCQNCLKNRSKCQRARCANYKAGKCSVPTCTRVHEDDERKYKRTVHAGHVGRKATGRMSKGGQGGDDDAKDGDDDAKGGDDDAEPGGGGVGLLAEGL